MEVNKIVRLGGSAIGVALLAVSLAVGSVKAQSTPSITDFRVPSTLTHLSATVVPVKADETVLNKIGKGFAYAYKVTSASFDFTAPDRLVYKARAGSFSATQIYTNSTRRTDYGFIHQTSDISKDVTRRKTIFDLGLLPQNYLETMQSAYVGEQTVDGVPCEVFVLRYITDRPDDNRRFEVWVSKDKHYVVQKTVWNGGNEQHETIKYKNPVEAMPGVWVPTVAEAYDKEGELGGVAEQRDIKAD